MGEPDPAVMLDILQLAEANAEAARQPLSMLFCLDAYDVVLPRLGIDKSTDLTYYQALLALNVKGVYLDSSNKTCSIEEVDPPSLSKSTTGEPDIRCDKQQGRFTGVRRKESVDCFLLKCRLMIISDAFRAWKTLVASGKRSKVCIRAWNAKAREHFELSALRRAVCSWNAFAQRRRVHHARLLIAKSHFIKKTRMKLTCTLRGRIRRRRRLQSTINSIQLCSIRCRQLFVIRRWDINATESRNQFLQKKAALEILKKRRVIRSWSNSMRSTLEDRSARLKLAVRFWLYCTRISRPNPLYKPDYFIQALLFWIGTSYSFDFETIITVRAPEQAFTKLQSVCALKWRMGSHANCKKRLRLLRQPTLTLILHLWRFTSQRNRRHQKLVLTASIKLFRKLVFLESELLHRKRYLTKYWTLQSWHRVYVFESSFRQLNPRFQTILQRSLSTRSFKCWRSFLVSKNAYNRYSLPSRPQPLVLNPLFRNLSARYLWIWRQELQNHICSRAWNVVADNYYTSHYGRRVFTLWKVAIVKKQTLSQLSMMVGKSHSHVILACMFKKWSQVLSMRKEFVSRNELAVSWCIARRKHAALNSWQTSQIISIRTKQLIKSAEAHFKRSQCRRLINACLNHRELNAKRKNFVAKSHRFFQQFRSREAIHQFKSNVQRRKLLRAQIGQIRSINLQRNLKLWRYSYVWTQVNRQVLRLRISFVFKKFRNVILFQQRAEYRMIGDFDKKRRNAVLSLSLYEWARTLSVRALIRSLESRVVESKNYQLRAEHWHAWRSCYRMRLRMTIDCRRFQSLFEDKLRHTYFLCWSEALKHHLYHQMCIDKVRKLIRGHLLGHTLHIWRAALAAHLARDVNATLFARACRRRRQARVFRCWNNAVRTHLRRKQLADLFYHRRLLRNFDRWLSLNRRSQQRYAQLSRMVHIFKLLYLRGRFRHFIRCCAAQRWQQEALQRCLTVIDRLMVRRSFHSWRKYRHHLPVLQRLRQLLSENLLRRTWANWLSEYRQRLARNQASLRSFFQNWSRRSLQRSLLRRVGRVIACRCRSSLIANHWRLWSYLYSCTATADRFASQSAFKRYFPIWHSHLRFNQHLAQLNIEADLFYQRMLRVRTFRKVTVICYYLQQTNDVIARRNSNLLSTVFNQWSRSLYVSRAASKHCLQALQLRFLVWKRFAKLQVLMKGMSKQLITHVIKNTFTSWRRATRVEHQLKTKTIELQQFRVMLVMRSAIRQFSQCDKQRRRIRSLLEISEKSNRCLQLKRAVAWLISLKNRRAAHKYRCGILNSKFLKRILFQRWKQNLCWLKSLRSTGMLVSHIRVKVGFRRWLVRLQRRSWLAKCRQSLMLSKRFCAWMRHTRKIAALRKQRFGVQNRISQIRQKFCFHAWKTVFVHQITRYHMVTQSEYHNRSRLLSHAWRIWAELHSAYEKERRLEERVFLARDHLRLVRGYVALLGHYRQKCRLRQFQQDVASARNHSTQRLALQAWQMAYADHFRIRQMRRVSIRMRQKFLWRQVTQAIQTSRFMSRLHQIYTRNLLNRSLRQWKRSVALKESLRQLVNARKTLSERLLFQKWRQFVKASRDRRESFAFLCRQLTIKCPFLRSKLHSLTDKMEIVFSAWCFWTRSRRQKTSASKQIIADWNQRRNSSLHARMFEIWRRTLVSSQYRKRFANLHQSQTVRFWLCWCRHRREMRQLAASAMLFHRRYLLITFYAKWHHRLLKIWRLLNIAGLLTARHREYVLRQFTSSWLERFLAKCHERDSYVRALEHYHVLLQRKAFVALRTRAQDTAQNAKKAAALILQYRLQLEEACFRIWHDYVRRRRHRRQTRRQREMALLNKRNVFLYWRMYVRRIRSTRKMLRNEKPNRQRHRRIKSSSNENCYT